MSYATRLLTDKYNEMVRYLRAVAAVQARAQAQGKQVYLAAPQVPLSRIVPAARPQSKGLKPSQPMAQQASSPFQPTDPFAKDVETAPPEQQTQTTDGTMLEGGTLADDEQTVEQPTSPGMAMPPEQPVDVGPAEEMGWEPSEEELLGGIMEPLDVPAPIDYLPTGPESFLDDEEYINPGFAGDDEAERERAPGIADEPESELLPEQATFMCKVYKDGGTAGAPDPAGSNCSWTYTVKDLAGNTIGTTKTPHRTRYPKTIYTYAPDASYGLAAYDGATLVLLVAFQEIETAGPC